MTRTIRSWVPVAAVCGLAILVAGVGRAAGPAKEHEFVGSANCKKCHLKEWKSWSETKMGKAFESLKPGVDADAKQKAGLDPAKDYTKDQTCVKCHVTGFGKKGGFTSVEQTPDRAGIGCEMCHGAGGDYTKSGFMTIDNKEYKKASLVAAGMVDVVGTTQCTTCHNEESPFVAKGYVFDFGANKDKGTHEKSPLKYKH